MKSYKVWVRTMADDHVPGVRTDVRRLPVTRGDCADVERPCLHLLCPYNLSIEITPSGGITIWHPGAEPETVEPPEGVSNCALDYAEDGGMTLSEIGDLTGITRERVRQIEEQGLRSLRASRGRTCEEVSKLASMNGRDEREPSALPGNFGRSRGWDEV